MKLSQQDVDNLRNFAKLHCPNLDHVLVIEDGKAEVHLSESYSVFGCLHPVASIRMTGKEDNMCGNSAQG